MAREMRTPEAAQPDQRGRSAVILTVPNALSVLRVLLIPPFLTYYLRDELAVAVVLFAAAAATDVFDGLLARLLRQRSSLGALLDPFADKLLGLASLAALTLHGPLPVWLLGLSLARDAVVLGIASISCLRGLAVAAAPTRLGKYATFFTNAAVIVALAWQITYAPWLAGYVIATTLVAAECLGIAALQYAWRFATRDGSTPPAHPLASRR